MSITLTADQQAAYSAIVTLMTTDQKILVIEGAAGCGKTTLIKSFMDDWPSICQLSAGAFKDMPIVLTATTNKAADALSMATGRSAVTLHAEFGLRVENTGFRTTRLIDTGLIPPKGQVFVIDEASFIDAELLGVVLTKTQGSKIIFLGDPNQLKPVNASTTPVFESGFPTVTLNTIVRQTNSSPLQAVSRDLRTLVQTGVLPKLPIDGQNLIHLPRHLFEQELVNDCKTGAVVRALSWTNDRAKHFNQLVVTALTGRSDIAAGDEVSVNKQIQRRGVFKLATDSTVKIQEVGDWEIDRNNITSRDITLTTGIVVRQAQDINDVTPLIKDAYARDNKKQAYMLENMYADLRLTYASTVNKSQGSTYDIVYIDLDDIGRCSDKNQVHRMLYVAASRARSKVVFTGDI